MWLLAQLGTKAVTLGLTWLSIGVLYLAYLTRGFSKAPPEMDFTEDATALRPAGTVPEAHAAQRCR